VCSKYGKIISGQAAFYASHHHHHQCHRHPNSPEDGIDVHPSHQVNRTVDLRGRLLSPGFIDIQINGAYGIDFSETDFSDPKLAKAKYLSGLDAVAKRLVEMGTTSFVPTVITQKAELYREVSQLSWV
jgi:N-acetylglucosamine-6-phosphate deacetylase